MIKVLARSIREYKKASILTPLLVTVEVIMECSFHLSSPIWSARCRPAAPCLSSRSTGRS